LDHPLVKEVRRALSRGELLGQGEFAGTLALDSPHLLEEAVAAGLKLEAILFVAEAPSVGEHAAMYRLSPAAFKKVASTESPQGVIALARPRAWEAHKLFQPAPAMVLILAALQDPGNAGTLLRTAEAFGATGALLLRGTVHATNPKLLRGAAGSTFRLPHMAGVQLDAALAMCAVNGATLLALDPRAAETLDDVDLCGPIAIAVGAEGAGLPPDLLDNARAVSIPRARRVESLNAAVAGSLALYEAARQRGHHGAL
jgi:TrmH family RNA methyltransferase